MKRRQFIKTVAAAGAGWVILPSGTRAGQKLQYDPAAGRVTNAREANEYLGRKYRAGWTLNG